MNWCKSCKRKFSGTMMMMMDHNFILPQVTAILIIITAGFTLQITATVPVVSGKDGNKVITKKDVGQHLSSSIKKTTSYCPETNDEKLNWTKPMGDLEFAYIGYLKQLWCCASGYRRITWSRRTSESPWQQVKLGNGTSVGHNQQQLLIQRFTKGDGGVYRCVAEDRQGKQTITHEYQVVEEEPTKCDPANDPGPTFGKPLQNNTVRSAKLGEDLTIPCLVSFGRSCGFLADLLSVVQWFGVKNDTCSETLLDLPRAEKVRSSERNIWLQNLHIRNITKNDFGQRWCCQASRNGKKTVIRIVGLQPPLTPTTVVEGSPESIKLIVSVLVSAVSGAVIVLIILWCYRLEILLLYHAKYGEKPNRVFDGMFDNDLILIHSGTRHDFQFVRHILFDKLEQTMHFRVFLPERDFDLGYVDNDIINALRRSQKIVVILSNDFLSQRLSGHIHNYIINERRNEDVIYIQYHNIKSRLWNSTEFIENIEILHKSVKNASRSWLHIGKKLKWCEDYDEVRDGRLVANERKTRVIKKFWKQLLLHLPPRREEGNESRSLPRPAHVV